MTLDSSTRETLREARHLTEAGRLPEAIVCYERLLAARPGLPNAWFNLARLQRHVGDLALNSYQQALANGIARAEEVHLNRAVIFSDELHQPEAAERELTAALALNATYLPALLNLGNLHEDLGRRDAAREVYERILSLEPRSFDALARYANLTSISAGDHPVLAHLRAAIADTGNSAADRAALGFSLGRALDACGEYDQAFEAYTAANQASRASAVGVRYDRAGWERMVDRMIAAFPAAPAGHARAAADTLITSGASAGISNSSGAPIFICGMFRSGSTLVEQLLARHPEVTAAGELDLLPGLAPRVLTSFPDTIASAPPALLAESARQYRETLSRIFPGARRITDKRPDNFVLIGLIKSLFPEAKIVHTVRDALDNCLSVFFLHLDHRMSYALDLMDIGHYYRHYLRLMAHWKRLFGPDILDVRYDSLVRGPEAVMRPLLEFLGLAWDERCLQVSANAAAVRTASVWQVREPLYQRSSGRARHYARQLAQLRAYLENSGELA
jgi:tetratricopeptide (TPR) repeat protein